MSRSATVLRLDITSEEPGEGVTAALPAGAAGRWCGLRLFLPVRAAWWARVTLTDPARAQVVRSVFLGPPRPGHQGSTPGIWRETLVHVPGGAAGLTLHIFAATADGAVLSIAVLNRWELAARLVWRGRHLLRGALSGRGKGKEVFFLEKKNQKTFAPEGQHPRRHVEQYVRRHLQKFFGSFFQERTSSIPSGVVGRLRAVLGQAPARAGEVPPYDYWMAVCESALPAPPAAPALDVQAVIVGDSGAGLAATLASLRAQSLPAGTPPWIAGVAAGSEAISADWIVILQAGEVLAPDAFAWFAHVAAVRPDAAAIVADFDRIDADGSRRNPVFLPGADALLLRSSLPAAGACAVRWQTAPFPAETNACAVRQALLLRAPDNVVHVPRILTHLAADASSAIAHAMPVARATEFAPSVAALVPSLARSSHVAACLRSLIEDTYYARLRVMMLLSAPQTASPRVLRRVRGLPRVEIRNVKLDRFNYAAVNNAGAALAQDSEFLLLLNDDVAPIAPDWLDHMLAHMQDPRVGIVGARLLYGNGMVQHEGVIMGLADLCEHAGRLRRGDDAGPHGIGVLSREVSAVTAACMLVRASLYRDVGGMDEGFAIALNDVDFCLRARQAGWRIVYCAEAVLHHYESLSLGRHYAGGRAALEGLEVRRLRDRWGELIAADPYYSPLASLEPGREWQPAFCPRPSLPYLRQVTARHPNPPAEDSKITH